MNNHHSKIKSHEKTANKDNNSNNATQTKNLFQTNNNKNKINNATLIYLIITIIGSSLYIINVILGLLKINQPLIYYNIASIIDIVFISGSIGILIFFIANASNKLLQLIPEIHIGSLIFILITSYITSKLNSLNLITISMNTYAAFAALVITISTIAMLILSGYWIKQAIKKQN